MAGYIRQDTSDNIADGKVINAADFDNEYNAIEAAFHATTGHTHDGTAAEGAPITKIGPTQDVVASASTLRPKTDNTVDLGSASFEFKDLYLDGTANIDSLVADTADINGGTIDGVTIGGASAGAGTFTTLNATTVDTTNIEVTSLKAKDGTSAGSIADSTGVVTLASSILTTTDINGGSIDGTAIGAASASTGAFTTLAASGAVTLSGGTANGVLYLDGSKVVTSGTALTFTGSVLGVNNSGDSDFKLTTSNTGSGSTDGLLLRINSTGSEGYLWNWEPSSVLIFGANGSEQMRLTSTGLGIGTSNPGHRLDVTGAAGTFAGIRITGAAFQDAGFIANRPNNGNSASLYFTEAGANVAAIHSRGSSYGSGLNGALQIINGSNSLTYDSSGNLGIGTSSPQSRLEARQDQAGAITRVIVNNNNATAGSGSSFDYYFGTTRLGGLTHAFSGSAYLGFDVWNGSAATERMRLDAPGNLGLGVTPSAWGSGTTALEVGAVYSKLSSSGTYGGALTNNAYYNSGWKYEGANFATLYLTAGGVHSWHTAPSGTAGNPISFSQAMTLDASGSLLVGTTSSSFKLNVTTQSGADRDVFIAGISGASNGLYVQWNHATAKTHVRIADIPISSAGLPSGTLWNDGGTLKIT
jgi:hypothetical protein